MLGFVTAKKYIALVCLCLMIGALTGCGTKGPLYIPEREYPQN